MESSLRKTIYPFTFLNPNSSSHRGVAPVIATLLLVAISSVGGSSAFVYSQDSFENSQISGSTTVEFIKIIGYDSRDVEKLMLHDGNEILAKNCCGTADGAKSIDERIAIYVQNNSVSPVTISELRFGGDVYSFTPASKIGEFNKIGNGHKPHPNEYIIVNYHIDGKNYDVVEDSSAKIQPGDTVTILLDLGRNVSMFHDSQVKITTTNGNVFVSQSMNGQSSL